jgi:hypothetical protein
VHGEEIAAKVMEWYGDQLKAGGVPQIRKRILMELRDGLTTASANTFIYNITANAWDTVTFGGRPAAMGAGCVSCPSLFLRPDTAKQARNSYIFSFRVATSRRRTCSTSLAAPLACGPPRSHTAAPAASSSPP